MHSAAGTRRLNAARLELLRLAGPLLGRLAATPARQPQRVLLIRPDHIGDVLLTAPAIALLRTSLPNAQLTYAVGPWSVEAARNGPPPDEIITLRFPGFTRRRPINPLQPYALLLREAIMLRQQGFGLAVVFRPDHWWGALLAAVAGIPVRVGSLTPETAPLLTHSRAPASGEHAADSALAIARLALQAVSASSASTAPETASQFNISDAARAEAKSLGLPDAPLVAIHPSAGAPLKSWPVSSWSAVADALIAQGVNVVLTGAPDDGPLLTSIANRMAHQVETACGQALDVTAAIFERCAVVVTVDSGAGHLAAAVGTPTVRLFGPAPASTFGPWPARADQRVLVTTALGCVPCGHLESPPCGARQLPACMLAHGVEHVVNAVRAQLNHG